MVGVPSLAAGQRPVTQGMPLPFTAEDQSHAVYRLTAYGFTDAQACALLERLAREGVRSARRCVEAMSVERLAELRRETAAREVEAEAPRRGDLIRPRFKRRWQPRTSTTTERGVRYA